MSLQVRDDGSLENGLPWTITLERFSIYYLDGKQDLLEVNIFGKYNK